MGGTAHNYYFFRVRFKRDYMSATGNTPVHGDYYRKNASKKLNISHAGTISLSVPENRDKSGGSFEGVLGITGTSPVMRPLHPRCLTNPRCPERSAQFRPSLTVILPAFEKILAAPRRRYFSEMQKKKRGFRSKSGAAGN